RPAGEEGDAGAASARPARRVRPGAGGRVVHLQLHLAAVTGAGAGAGVVGVGLVEEAGGRVLSVEQVRAWCAGAGTVLVRPVLDLNAEYTGTGHDPPPLLREQVMVRDRTCVFPYCQRPARGCDLDHIVAYRDGGPTASSNL